MVTLTLAALTRADKVIPFWPALVLFEPCSGMFPPPFRQLYRRPDRPDDLQVIRRIHKVQVIRLGEGKELGAWYRTGYVLPRIQVLLIEEITTDTLGDSVDYAPYEGTRAFYFKHGFQIYQRAQTDNPGCPEEIKIRKRVA